MAINPLIQPTIRPPSLCRTPQGIQCAYDGAVGYILWESLMWANDPFNEFYCMHRVVAESVALVSVRPD